MPVVELARIEGPAPVLRVVHDRVADPLDPLGERRQVSLHKRLGLGHRLDDAVGDVVHEVDEEVPGAHRGIADLEFERPLRRIEPLQTAHAPILRDLARSEIGRLGAEGVHSGIHERSDSLPDDQIDQIVRRVVAARVLAGEHVRTDDDVPVLADHFTFEESLVDRAELLNPEIPVVDVPASERRPLERQRVDHVGHHGIAQPDARQQGRAVAVEQPSVVGRKTYRGVALVDGPAQIVERGPVACRRDREHIPLVLAASDVAAHPVPERVVVVPAVPDRQEIAVLRVEHEQEPVEHYQRRVPHLVQRGVGIGLGKRPDKVREDLLEDHRREAARHPFPMVAGLGDGPLVERPLVRRVGKEGIPPEHQREHLEPVPPLVGREAVAAVGRMPKNRPEIELEELLGDRTRPGPVQPPAGTVRQDAPAHLARGHVVDAP